MTPKLWVKGMMYMNSKEAALDYVRMGWLVLPLYGIKNLECACGKKDCNSAGRIGSAGGKQSFNYDSADQPEVPRTA